MCWNCMSVAELFDLYAHHVPWIVHMALFYIIWEGDFVHPLKDVFCHMYVFQLFVLFTLAFIWITSGFPFANMVLL